MAMVQNPGYSVQYSKTIGLGAFAAASIKVDGHVTFASQRHVTGLDAQGALRVMALSTQQEENYASKP